MGANTRKLRKRMTALLMAVLLCLSCVMEFPGFGATAQAASKKTAYTVTVTGGKGASVTSPEQAVEDDDYSTSFICVEPRYVKLCETTDPAPEFQKFDHWHVTVVIRVTKIKTTPVAYSYEEDLTDFCFRPDLDKFTEEEQRLILLAAASDSYTVSGSVSVQAVYVDNYWLVTFDPNDAENEMDAQKVEKGQDYVLPECTLTKERYVFAGWQLAGSSEVLPAGETITVENDICLTATWQIDPDLKIYITDKNFPDQSFREMEIKARATDSNQDGVLTANEISQKTYMSLETPLIKSLEGIGFFPELTALSCGSRTNGPKIKELDLSKNKKIEGIGLCYSELPALSLSGFQKLTSITLYNNTEMDSLELTDLPKLKTLSCELAGKMEDLTLQDLPNLKFLTIYRNLKLKTLSLTDLPELKEVECNSNQLYELNLSNCPAITSLDCSDNEIRYLDLTNNADLEYLDCRNNQIKVLDVSNCPKLKTGGGGTLLVDEGVVIIENTPEYCQITVSSSLAEGGTAYGTGRWIKGETVSLLAKEKDGYLFQAWTENGEVVSEDAVYEFIGAQDRTLVATFEHGSRIFVEGGTASKDKAEEGETITITAGTAPEGYSFDHWEVLAGDVTLASLKKTSTTFVMGAEEVSVRATWILTADKLSVSIAHAISLENSMAISFLVSKTDLKDYSDVRLVVEKKCYKNGAEGYDMVRTELAPEASSPYGGYVQFKYTGVGAKAMGDDVYAVLYATKDGKEYHTVQDSYSVKKYAYNTLRKTDTAEGLKTLLVDMLNYGAAAQEYFKYNAKHKVNADLTESEQELGTATNPILASCSKTTTTQGAKIKIYGKQLSLENSVEIKYLVVVPATGVDTSKVRLEIEYEDAKHGKHGKIVPGTDLKLEGGFWKVSFDIIETKDMGQVVTATLYEDDEFVACVDTYSIESYCRSKTKNDPTTDEEARLQALCFALMKFNRSASSYFK